MMIAETKTVLLALSSGEHIITEMDYDDTSTSYICNKPMQIMGQQDSNGQMKMGISPYMPYAESTSGFAIPISMAILALPSDGILAAYQSATGKIITPPQQKIILG